MAKQVVQQAAVEEAAADGLGGRLREERLRQSLTVLALAIRSGITPNTVSNAEAGKGLPRLQTLQAMADGLGVSITYLLTGKGRRAQ